MNEQEERYLHFAFSIDSLNSAWRILNELKQHPENSLAGFAFQFALVEYSKPYKISYGVAIKKHWLSDEFVPTQHVELHKRILNWRDKFFAHTDLSIRDAKIYIVKTKDRKIVSRAQNAIYGTEEMKNIDSILDLIEKTLDVMYEEAKRLEDNLPMDSADIIDA